MRLVVVGSGIVGSACAYAASVAGAEVTLIDSDKTGRATSAGAGIISPWASAVDDPDWNALACSAARAYPALVAALAEEGETAVGYRQVGALVLADTPEQQREISQRLLARQAQWPEMGDIGSLDPGQARGLFPPLRPDAWAVHIGGAARVDGRLLSAALRRAAGRNGATVLPGDAVLRCAHGVADGVTVAGRFLAADAVVAATGAWTDAFVAPAGLTLGVTAQRGQIVHIGLGMTDTSRWPAILPSGTGLGASGLTMGPYAGELAARTALGASLPLDLSPFSPLRATSAPR